MSVDPLANDEGAARRTAMVIGAAGQDGAFLARLLLDKGYRVVGVERTLAPERFSSLRELGVDDAIELIQADITDFDALHQAICHTSPDEIYNLAAQSSVGLSFEKPLETYHSIATGAICVLESLRRMDKPVRLLNANSSMLYGDLDAPADEATPFDPRSPYAAARVSAYWSVACYRKIFDLFASSAILFNHESPLRPPSFVTAKIVSTAVRIAQGSDERLTLGNVDVVRDWGWAEEYVEGMWRILQHHQADDFVMATGQGMRLGDFVTTVFETLDLDWRDNVDTNPALIRKDEAMVNIGNPSKAHAVLGWRAKTQARDVAVRMVEAELARQGSIK